MFSALDSIERGPSPSTSILVRTDDAVVSSLQPHHTTSLSDHHVQVSAQETLICPLCNRYHNIDYGQSTSSFPLGWPSYYDRPLSFRQYGRGDLFLRRRPIFDRHI